MDDQATSTTVEANSRRVSLLWPAGREVEPEQIGRGWNEAALTDLGLDKLAGYFIMSPQHLPTVKRLFLEFCRDTAVIRYRQAVLDDLLQLPELAEALETLQPMIGEVTGHRRFGRGPVRQLNQIVSRLAELEMYVACVRSLKAILAQASDGLRSEGLRRLLDLVREVAGDPTFQTLAETLPGLRERLSGLTSVTVGINLDAQLRPEEATILALNNRRFSGETFLDRLFGRKPVDEFQGLGPLHTQTRRISDSQRRGLYTIPDSIELGVLFRDLDRLLEGAGKYIASALDRFARISTGFLTTLEFEFAFYVNAVKLIRRLEERGLPLCRPEIAPTEERIFVVDDLYELNLALRTAHKQTESNLAAVIVTNQVEFGPEGRIFILTGPNQGGKTTYTQAVGVAQVLAQVGLYVPGTRARISPVDGIYTHFPVGERPGMEAGRFGEEAKRLSDIFQHATRYSLILMNESLASTSEGESLYLAQDVVRGLKLLGVRAIFATHLHPLAERVEAINAESAGDSRLISMVAGITGVDGDGADQTVRRTYKMRPGPPNGLSYARDIAAKYGISFEQILETLQGRQQIDADASSE